MEKIPNLKFIALDGKDFSKHGGTSIPVLAGSRSGVVFAVVCVFFSCPLFQYCFSLKVLAFLHRYALCREASVSCLFFLLFAPKLTWRLRVILYS